MNPIVKTEVPLSRQHRRRCRWRKDEPNDGNSFDAREPKFHLVVEIDRQQVEKGHDDPEYTDEDGDVNRWIPVLDNKTSCSQLKGKCDCLGKSMDPSHRKTKTWINQSSSV